MKVEDLLFAERELDAARQSKDERSIAAWAIFAQHIYDNLDPLEHLDLQERTA